MVVDIMCITSDDVEHGLGPLFGVLQNHLFLGRKVHCFLPISDCATERP